MTGYIDSYYSRTLEQSVRFSALEETLEAEVCVIGGGLAGLATALGLAERGRKVVLLEARRVGWGASGRNGGFCLSGFAASPQDMIKKIGLADTRTLFGLTKAAQKLIRKRIKDFDIPCEPVDGSVVASWYDDENALRRKQEFWTRELGEAVEYWPREKTRSHYVTDRYYDALFFPENFHLHPLRYVLGLAAAFTQKGGLLFENSPVVRAAQGGDPKIVHTEKGCVKANEIVFCGSAYFVNRPEKKLAQACLPISTYVMVTEAIPPNVLKSAIRAPYAIRDSRYADDYYRPLPDGRLLWGGRIGIGRDPADLAAEMRRDMVKIYPQFKDVKADIAWSGLMGYTVHRMPLIGQLRPGVWYCTNFGGNGVGPTTAGGEIIAKAIAEGDETYKLFKPFGFEYTGGLLGPLVAQAVYRSWELSDWLGEFKNKKKAG